MASPSNLLPQNQASAIRDIGRALSDLQIEHRLGANLENAFEKLTIEILPKIHETYQKVIVQLELLEDLKKRNLNQQRDCLTTLNDQALVLRSILELEPQEHQEEKEPADIPQPSPQVAVQRQERSTSHEAVVHPAGDHRQPIIREVSQNSQAREEITGTTEEQNESLKIKTP